MRRKKEAVPIKRKQKEYGGKAPSAHCKLSLLNLSETLQESRSYIYDKIKKIQWKETKRWPTMQRALHGTLF